MDGIQLNITTSRSLKRKSSSSTLPKDLNGSTPEKCKQKVIELEQSVPVQKDVTSHELLVADSTNRPVGRQKTYAKSSSYEIAQIDKINHLNEEKDVIVPKETLFSGDSFASVSLHSYLVKNIVDRLGFTKMTLVQKLGIPVVQKGCDVLVKSQTGSGKTLVYALPILNKLGTLNPPISRSDGVYCLVITPTRELAVQSYDVFHHLVQSFIKITPGCLCGGEKKKSEKARIRKGINILVSTPGRLLDHLKTSANLAISLSRLQFLVIDEADRLLEGGFEFQVNEILEIIKSNMVDKTWQTILLSATLTPAVERLVSLSLRNPEFIDVQALSHVSESGEKVVTEPVLAVPEMLKQYYVVTPTKLKLAALTTFLLRKRRCKIVVFFPTQDIVEFVFSLYENFFDKLIPLLEASASRGITDKMEAAKKTALFRLHGEMGQSERSDVFRRFSQADSGLLFSTDVAARGLDLPSIKWVVQFQAPESPAVYVHRVGRTARAGRTGSTMIFLIPNENGYVKMMRQDYGMNLKSVRFSSIAAPNDTRNKSDSTRSENSSKHLQVVFDVQHALDEAVNSDKALHERARKAYVSFIRAYATYRNDQRIIFNVRNGLHLGHIARAFCMKDETPTEINNILRRNNDAPSREKFQRRPDSGRGYVPPMTTEGAPSSYPTWRESTFNKQSDGHEFDGKEANFRPSSNPVTKRGTKVINGRRSGGRDGYQVAMASCSEFASGL